MYRALAAGCAVVLWLLSPTSALAAEPIPDWRNAPWQAWHAPPKTPSPLIGTIWSSKDKAEITPDALVQRLLTARHVLLGEVHDNPEVHRLQAWLVAALAQATKRPAVLMEMITDDKAEALQAFLAKGTLSPAELGPALGWQESGWPEWPFYQPIAEAALEAKLPLLPGDAARTMVRKVSRGGLAMLNPADRARLGLDAPLPAGLREALAIEIGLAHCGLLPDAIVPAMSLVQRFRDAVMADKLRSAAATHGATILIAGNGHVRTDRGVPAYLAADGPVATVMLLEADPETTVAADLVPQDPDGKPAANYVWFVPPATRPDQCEEMRKAMENKGAN